MRDFQAFVREQVAPLALPARRERKIIEEWSAQLEEMFEELRATGLSDEEAWRELQRQVPDWRALSVELLDRGSEPIFRTLTSGLVRDAASALRLLVKDRGFSATIILTLAVCLGANAAIFTVVDSVLLRPIPVPEPDRLVGIGDVYPTITPNDILANDVPSYFDRQQAVTALEEQALFTLWFDSIRIDGVPEELRGMRATPSLFRVLRVEPALGRTFTDADGEVGADRKIILSHGLWQRLYGGDREIIGQTLRLGWTGQPYTIVGVMPEGFSFFDQGYDGHARTGDVQFWIPLAFTPEQRSDNARTRYGYFHVGRLHRDATLAQVQEQVNAVRASIGERFPEYRLDELGMHTVVTPLGDALTHGISRTLYLLWAGAAVVLLIGVINIANLALARASTRARELATRLALGAGRFVLARQLMIEAMVPATGGGVLGLAVAYGILRALTLSGLQRLRNAEDIQITATVAVSVIWAAATVGLLIGVIPAMTNARVAFANALVDGSRTGTTGRSTRLFRRALVIAQVALSVVLLIAATLLLASFRHLLSIDAGFRAARVTTATVFPPPSRYPNAQAVDALATRILDRVRGIPGVEAAGITSNIALSGFESPSTVSTTRTPAADQPALVPSVVAVTPGYFETMGTALARGRYFAESDRSDGMPVAIVDERLAARLWPSADAIGQPLYRGDAGPYTVVGVVREVRFESLARSIEAIGTAYFPHAQAPPMPRLRWVAVRTLGDTAALVRQLRAALAEIDPDLPLSDIQTMNERQAHSLVSERLAMTLASMFGLVALFLSVLGIYAVLVHLVARRTREFGIRLALGSTVRGVFRLVLREGVTLIATGLGIGIAGAVAVGRVLEGQVFGVRPTDPVLIGSVVLATGCVALAACLVPARRATRVDPVDVLSEP